MTAPRYDNDDDHFDDDDYPESDDSDEDEPDDWDDCPNCGAEIYAEAMQCPECGHWILDEQRQQRPWESRDTRNALTNMLRLIAGLVIIGIAAALVLSLIARR